MTTKRCAGVVVDVDPKGDPNKRGKVCVKFTEQNQAGIPDTMYSWYPIRMFGSTRGIGTTGHDLIPGSKVEVEFDANGVAGQVIGTLSNVLDSDGVRDFYPSAEKIGNVWDVDWKQWWKDSDGKPFDITTAIAQKLNQQENATPEPKKDPAENTNNNVKHAERYGPARGLTSTKQDVGKVVKAISSWKNNDGPMESATNFIKEKLGNKGELLQNQFAMLDNLKSAVKSGSPKSALNSIGGIGNLIGALQSLSQRSKTKSPENDQDDYLDFIRRLYEEVTTLSSRDDRGNDTPEFITWKEFYIRTGEFLTS
jgi:hypothetical protein